MYLVITQFFSGTKYGTSKFVNFISGTTKKLKFSQVQPQKLTIFDQFLQKFFCIFLATECKRTYEALLRENFAKLN